LSSVPFNNRKSIEKELEDLVLLAKREQMASDEELRPLTAPREALAFTGNVQRIARFEGWSCSESDVDAAVQLLAVAHMMVTDGNPAQPGPGS